MNEVLPLSWVISSIGNISEIVGGGTPNSSDKTNFCSPPKGIPWLSPVDLSGYTLKYVSHGRRNLSEKGYNSCSAKLIPKGTVVFSSRAPIGYVAIANNPLSTNQGFRSIVPHKYIFNEYIYYYLYASKAEAEKLASGSTFKEISGSKLKQLPIPIPPLNEQKRIVAKLDAVMPRIAAVKERLEEIPAILKRFRQSVLTAAVTGKLTEKWRNEHPEAGKWKDVTIEDLAEYVTSGSRGWAKYYSNKGAIFVRAQNINTDTLVLDDVAYVKLPKKIEGIRTKIKKFDILVTITGANVTKTALVKTDIPEAYVNQHVALLRPKRSDFSTFVHLWLISPNAGRTQLEDAAYGAGKPGLNLKNIKSVRVELPPPPEQKEIVRQVDKLFALADKVEAHYQKARNRVDKLSQSVLAKAFRGELVPQYPNDEPAEKLLERILAEKARMAAELKGTVRQKRRASKKNRSKSPSGVKMG